ncbi:2'-deoxycytidine 5'-triphosphate deaminase, partial [Mesorhizobium sp. M7A.F.Ca.US.003.02.1.1]
MRQTGILPDQDISALLQSGALKSARALDADQIQPASLDLRLGDKAWRVRASFLPGPNHKVSEKLDRLQLHEINLAEGAVLETGCVYI